MRTKTLLLTAALAAAGAASAMAQNVYSVNAVGYVNETIPPGFSLRVQPFKGGARDLATLIPNAPNGLTVYKLNDNGSFEIDTWNPAPDSFWDSGGAMTIPEGKGIIVNNGGGSFVNTFVGEVAQGTAGTGNQLQNPIAPGVVVRSSLVPQRGLLSTDLGFIPAGALVTTQYGPDGQSFIIKNYDPTIGTVQDNWLDGEPTIEIGEAFYIQSGGESWNRNFSVN